jgi:Protein of unknown function (DUF2934)
MPRAKTAKTPTNGKTAIEKISEIAHTVAPAKKNGASVDLESKIRVRAYELYVERGRTPGHENDDWLLAEREVKSSTSEQHIA